MHDVKCEYLWGCHCMTQVELVWHFCYSAKRSLMSVVSASSKCPKSIIQERNETGSSVKQFKGFWGIVTALVFTYHNSWTLCTYSKFMLHVNVCYANCSDLLIDMHVVWSVHTSGIDSCVHSKLIANKLLQGHEPVITSNIVTAKEAKIVWRYCNI